MTRQPRRARYFRRLAGSLTMRPARRLPFLTLVMLLALLPLAVHAAPENERRIALVVGTSAYQNAPHLANPVNDARAIGDSLRRLKFEVTELYDPDFRALNSGVRSFGIQAATADVAVIYYAGHGVQVDRENYLIPMDAQLERERDLVYEAMPLQRLLNEVSQAHRIGIVLLDSCRNNPFLDRVSRSMSVAGRAVATAPGMARVDNVPRNTMVVMAAKADQIAEDGQNHSPFAAALLEHFRIPGLELSLFFRSVRDTVLHATSNRQEPYVFSSLGAEPFYFYPRPPNRPPTIAAITPLELTEVAGPTSLGLPEPADPDQDPLTIRIIGLPRFGEVRVDGKTISLNTVISAEKLKTAVYKPDGKSIGSAGTLDMLIEDGRGGSITASLPITVRSSHHPPILGGPNRIEVGQQLLGISAPVSPEGDPLTVTITALPRGIVRSDINILHPGDHVTPQELSRLAFLPDAGVLGPAGTLRYTVDNGHGGIVEGSLAVDVRPAPGGSDQGPEAALWATVRNSSNPLEYDAFLRLFPASPYTSEARRRRAELAEAEAARKRAEQQAAIEAQRIAEQKAAAEARRIAEQKAATEAAQQVAAQQAAVEAQRIAKQKAAAEARRIAEQKAATEAAQRLVEKKAIEDAVPALRARELAIEALVPPTGQTLAQQPTSKTARNPEPQNAFVQTPSPRLGEKIDKADGLFDGSYAGTMTVINGSEPVCGSDRDIKVSVKDRKLEYAFGSLRRKVALDQDGIFQDQYTNGSTYNTLTSRVKGRISNSILEADLNSVGDLGRAPLCSFHWSLRKLVETKPAN